MNPDRRAFLEQSLAAGGFVTLPASGAPTPAIAQTMLAAAGQEPGAPRDRSVDDLAANLQPDITYLSASISLESFSAAPNGAASGVSKESSAGGAGGR